jgi:hypothetical protein
MESKISLRLSYVVFLPTSPPIKGLNSTTSMFHSILRSAKVCLSFTKNYFALSFLIPLGAMVPVEGISIGSIESISKLTKATSIFSFLNQSNIYW